MVLYWEPGKWVVKVLGYDWSEVNPDACCGASSIVENEVYNIGGKLEVFTGSIAGNGGGGNPLSSALGSVHMFP